MKFNKFILPFILAVILFLFEFSNSRRSSLFPINELFTYLSFIILVIVFLVYLIQGIKEYNKSKKAIVFIYPFVCLIILTIVTGHSLYRKRNDESESLCKVGQTGKIEGREALLIDFKKNGSLKISATYKFSDSYFWGNYSTKGDTLLLHIQPNFLLGKKAVFTNNNFRFIDDTSNNSKLFLYQQ